MQEVQRALESASGSVVPTATAQNLLRKLDENGDGAVTQEEFDKLDDASDQEAIVASVSADRVRARLESFQGRQQQYQSQSTSGEDPKQIPFVEDNPNEEDLSDDSLGLGLENQAQDLEIASWASFRSGKVLQ